MKMKKLTAIILAILLILASMPLTLAANDNGENGENGNNGGPPPSPPPSGATWDEISVAVDAATAGLRAEIDRLNRQLANTGDGIIRLVTPQNITIEPGETREITITVRNVGSRSVQNLFTLPAPGDDAPFTVEFLRNTNSISSLGANSQRTMTMRITANANAEQGNYALNLNHFFRDQIGDTETSTDRINVRIGGEEGEPTLEISGMNAPTATVTPGQTATISFTLQNTGDAEARNVNITATTADVIDPMTQSEISIPVLAAGESRTVSFGFAATEDAATRTYNVRFTVTYGAGDAARTFNQVAPLAVYNPDGDDDLPNLEFRQMTAPTGRINVGQTGLVSFYLFNSGEEEARNVRVTAAPASDSIVPTTQSTVVIPELAPGESHPISFGFRPTRTAATQTHDIQFTATYGTGDAARSFSQFAAFNVYNPDVEDDDDRRQIPRIIIHDSIVYPAVPRAGQEFDLTITFRNTNATQGVNNIRILMEEVRAQNLPGGQQTQEHIAGFTPVGSNTLFIDRLGPQSEVTKVLRFISSADGTPGMHNMRFTFDFQDDNFHEHESAEQISLQLAQVMRLELTEVNVGESVTAGGSVWFSFRVINSGRVNLLSTRVRAEGPEDVTEAGGEEGMFIGTINAQRWSNFEGRFDAPHDPGEHQFEFVITAEDNTGEPIELRHPFTLFVEDGMGFDFGDDMFMGDDFFHGGALPFPDDGMFFPDDGMFFEEANESGAFFSLVRGIFMRPVEPEGWDETFMGPFSPESAEMFGVDADHRVRLWVIIAPIVVILLAVAIPLLVIRNKRRRRLLFEDDED